MPETRIGWTRSGGWGAQLQYVHGLQEFELEMETLVERKAHMDVAVQAAKAYKFPLRDGSFLDWDEDSGVHESQWELRSQHWHGNISITSPQPQLGDSVYPLPAGRLELPVPSVREPTPDTDPAPRQMASRYHVVSLKYKARSTTSQKGKTF